MLATAKLHENSLYETETAKTNSFSQTEIIFLVQSHPTISVLHFCYAFVSGPIARTCAS